MHLSDRGYLDSIHREMMRNEAPVPDGLVTVPHEQHGIIRKARAYGGEEAGFVDGNACDRKAPAPGQLSSQTTSLQASDRKRHPSVELALWRCFISAWFSQG